MMNMTMRRKLRISLRISRIVLMRRPKEGVNKRRLNGFRMRLKK